MGTTGCSRGVVERRLSSLGGTGGRDDAKPEPKGARRHRSTTIDISSTRTVLACLPPRVSPLVLSKSHARLVSRREFLLPCYRARMLVVSLTSLASRATPSRSDATHPSLLPQIALHEAVLPIELQLQIIGHYAAGLALNHNLLQETERVKQMTAVCLVSKDWRVRSALLPPAFLPNAR